MVVLALGVFAGVPSAVARIAAAAPVLQVDAPSQVRVGEVIHITLSVRDAADVAGYETNLLFDPNVAEFAGLHQRDNDLRKLGRDVAPLAAIESTTGIAVGLLTCPVANCVARTGPRRDQGGRVN